MIKTLARIIILAIFLYEWNYRCGMQERAPPDHPFKSSQQYGSQYRYLTVLNYLLSIFINFLLVIGAVLPTAKSLGQTLHFSISFPVNVIVSVYFYTVYFIDRELIYPTIMQDLYKQWMSNTEHGLILPVAIFNLLADRHEIKKGLSAVLLITATAGYSVWIIHIFNVTGEWVYPFLNALGTDAVLYKFLPITAAVALIFQHIGFKIYENVHSNEKLKQK